MKNEKSFYDKVFEAVKSYYQLADKDAANWISSMVDEYHAEKTTFTTTQTITNIETKEKTGYSTEIKNLVDSAAQQIKVINQEQKGKPTKALKELTENLNDLKKQISIDSGFFGFDDLEALEKGDDPGYLGPEE